MLFSSPLTFSAYSKWKNQKFLFILKVLVIQAPEAGVILYYGPSTCGNPIRHLIRFFLNFMHQPQHNREYGWPLCELLDPSTYSNNIFSFSTERQNNASFSQSQMSVSGQKTTRKCWLTLSSSSNNLHVLFEGRRIIYLLSICWTKKFSNTIYFKFIL